MSETAYLVWKLRNERRVRDQDNRTASYEETTRRWMNAINKPADNRRFGKRALYNKLTWRSCLKNEEALPEDWPTKKGVLVGIARCQNGK